MEFGTKKRILYVAMKYDYGFPERGLSFEHTNFYDTLYHMGYELIYFDFMSIMQEEGRESMNRMLLEVTRSEKPDLLFCVLFTDELDKNVVREISENTDTVTLNWFCDDHWRFENYSRYWAPMFNWVTTTASSALPKYERLGYKNVIKTQWACNHYSYERLGLPFRHDVTFVGQPHGDRRDVIDTLRKAGIEAQVWGTGWESGRLSQEEMIRVFNQSRINLNLSNASVQPLWLGILPWRKSGARQQIKGRNFEVPGCGGFLLTNYADNLEEYYTIGKEIECFDDAEDLIAKIRYYLAHEDERMRIAEAGYRRTLAEHTYEHRFREIFSAINLRGP
jgi:spore maturation protein CgeB